MSGDLRLLLASGSADLRDGVGAVIAESGLETVTTVVTDTHGLFAAVERDSFDVVLVDEEIGPTPCGQAVRELVALRPFLGVVVLARDASPQALARAVDAGARATLQVPPGVEDLRGRLEQVAGWGRSLVAHLAGQGEGAGRRGTVVALAGAKGGVGTTVLATLLAQELVGRGRSTCLVDLDLRAGSVAFYADLDPRRDVTDLADVAQELTGRTVQEVVVRHPGGLVVLAAPPSPEGAEEVTPVAVQQVLAQLRTQFERVVVDVGSRLDEVVATALEVADEVVLVTQPDVVSLRAARRTLRSWEQLRIRERDGVQVVLNRCSRRLEVQPDLAEQILATRVLSAVPASFAELEPCVNSGTLLESPPAGVVRALAPLVAAADPRPTTAAAAGGPPAPRDAGRRGRRARHAAATGARRERSVDAGQVLVETPVVVGLLLTAALVCVQGLLVGLSVLLSGHAAAEASRVAAVSSEPADVLRAAVEGLPAGWDDDVRVEREPGGVVVTVMTPSVVPFLPRVPVERAAAVVAER